MKTRSKTHAIESVAMVTALIAAFVLPAAVQAQQRSLHVIMSDSEPIPYAYVSLQGGHAQLTDGQGEVSLGSGKKQTMNLEVRRIGYAPYFGKIEFADTATTTTVILTSLAQELGSVKVSGQRTKSSLELNGFYRRWLDGQKGALSAAFIGPEEIEKRNAARVSAMLGSINGVSMLRTNNGNTVVTSSSGSCAMAVVVDGRQVCPALGCKRDDGSQSGGLTDMNSVLIDQVVDMGSIAAIEVYRRGGNMPTDFHVDGECGAVAIWTGSRKR